LVAVGTYLSDRLFVNEGDDLQLIIEPDLHRRQPLRDDLQLIIEPDLHRRQPLPRRPEGG
jgi:hypothetical protein